MAVEEALAQGIAELEDQRANLSDEVLKISYFDDSWELFQQMVAFQLTARNDPAKAFEFADRARARTLLAAAEEFTDSRTRGLVEIQRLLPPTVVLVYYVTLADRLLIWTITSNVSQLVERRITHDDLTRLVGQYRVAIADGRHGQRANNDLYNALITPIGNLIPTQSTIVFVPDGNLQQLPFATLRHPVTGHYLVEDHSILMTPSASFFVAGLGRVRALQTQRLTSALLVGNPATTTNVALPGAEAEVTEAARLYPHHTVLTGSTATKVKFVTAAPEHDVVHFGGHAYVNSEYPLLSRLAFSSAGADNQHTLFAHEISKLRFPRTRLVVLAACSTAVGAVSRGEGVISVARPFLGAGVPVVVASQWDVNDGTTEQLFLAFHRELARTQDPVEALRAAQLTLLRSPDSLLASPATWGAFVALGTTAH
jgi:CHAT domain-containing protein